MKSYGQNLVSLLKGQSHGIIHMFGCEKNNKVVKYNTPVFSNFIFTCNVVHWSMPVNLASIPLLLTALTVI